MINVQKSSDSNGVTLTGDFFDFDRLYFAITKFTGYHGVNTQCHFQCCAELCESILGLCYELRHAWQGDSGIVEVYNGICDYWFDDYEESEAYENNCGGFDEEDEQNNDDVDDLFSIRFSRKTFPKVYDQNTYFSLQLAFPEAMYYALLLSDLLKKKDEFFRARKIMMEQTDLLQELNKEYYYFGAEEDVSRITLFIKGTLRTLYKFVGEEEYLAFMNKFDKIHDFSINCDLDLMNQLLEDYATKEYVQDDPKILMHTLTSFLKYKCEPTPTA